MKNSSMPSLGKTQKCLRQWVLQDQGCDIQIMYTGFGQSVLLIRPVVSNKFNYSFIYCATNVKIFIID